MQSKLPFPVQRTHPLLPRATMSTVSPFDQRVVTGQYSEAKKAPFGQEVVVGQARGYTGSVTECAA